MEAASEGALSAFQVYNILMPCNDLSAGPLPSGKAAPSLEPFEKNEPMSALEERAWEPDEPLGVEEAPPQF